MNWSTCEILHDTGRNVIIRAAKKKLSEGTNILRYGQGQDLTRAMDHESKNLIWQWTMNWPFIMVVALKIVASGRRAAQLQQ
jgi:hypothetical protein